MSGVVRSHPRRSAARSAASLPYARPKQPQTKKSPWAIATGLLNFFNPLRLRSQSPIDVDDDDDDNDELEPDDDQEDVAVSPPQSLSARGRQMARTLPAPPQPSQPAMEPAPCLLPDSSSPKKNLETVASFLEQRRGQTISPLEAEGLISLINKSTPPEEKPEPFRFSTSASLPSTPARGNSPAAPHDLFTLGTSASTSALNTSRANSPRKTLSKNPNGTYRWPGGGSARPSKNRYASPAFGTPSRSTPERMVFRDAPQTQTQTDSSPKRRRLETPPVSTPPPVPRSAAPGPSPTRAAAASQYFPFPASTPASSPASGPNATSHSATSPTPTPPAPAPTTTPARAALNLVKSLPVHPSPLRQAWGGSPASSVSSAGSPNGTPSKAPTTAATGTPTKAATLLTALIRDADAEVPKRAAEVRNPYQSASPVGVRVTNTHPPDRKRARATGRLGARQKELETKEKEKEVKEKEREKEREGKEAAVPPQAIIEATLPKGSKRSRPPAHFNASASLSSLAAPQVVSPRRSPRLEPQRTEVDEEIEIEMEKDEEEREAGAPAAKRARGPAVNGNGGGKGGMVNGSANTNGAGLVNGVKKAAEPAPPAPTPTPALSASTSAPSSFFSSGASPFGIPSSTSAGNTTTSTTSTTTTTTTTTTASPSVPFTLGSGQSAGFDFRMGPKPLATNAPKEPSKLRYSFAPPTPPPVADMDKDKEAEGSEKRLFSMGPPKSVPAPKAAPSTSAFGAPSTSASGAASNSASVSASNSKSVTPPHDPKALARALPASALPPFVFNVLTNAPAPSELNSKAREKARRLDVGALPTFDLSSAPAPKQDKGKGKAVQGFDWAAAGGAPPKPAGPAGAWMCETCMLSNGPEVLDKCTVCETPRPNAPAKPKVQGFDWAAAGVKPPKTGGVEGEWTCGTCMLKNGPEVGDKCKVCETPR